MTTERTRKSNSNESSPVQGESKESVNKNAPWQYGTSVTIGVITILLLAVALYYGLIGS